MPVSKKVIHRLLLKSDCMESVFIVSEHLKRKVQVDLYRPAMIAGGEAELLLFNDGQDLPGAGLQEIMDGSYAHQKIGPLVIAGIHAGKDRLQEYGVAGIADYKGRGGRAGEYASFVLKELFPCLKTRFGIGEPGKISFAGFSLGGLSALDLVWSHPDIFSKAGVFSGALWWRSRGLDDGYDEATDRIMHARVREGSYEPSLRFFFECGTLDEKCDRNHNGVIDAIDDTRDLIMELEQQGYSCPGDICYHEIPGGKHHMDTWKRALPVFLQWGWPVQGV